MVTLEFIYNSLTAGIFALFGLICVLVSNGNGINKCTCSQDEFIGDITPSNNFIVREPGKPLRKLPLYQFLQGNDIEPSSSCEECCTSTNTDLDLLCDGKRFPRDLHEPSEASEEFEVAGYTFRVKVKLPEDVSDAGNVKKKLIRKTPSGNNLVRPATPGYDASYPSRTGRASPRPVSPHNDGSRATHSQRVVSPNDSTKGGKNVGISLKDATDTDATSGRVNHSDNFTSQNSEVVTKHVDYDENFGLLDDTVLIYDKNTGKFKVFDKNAVPASAYEPESCRSICDKMGIPICVLIAKDLYRYYKRNMQNSRSSERRSLSSGDVSSNFVSCEDSINPRDNETRSEDYQFAKRDNATPWKEHVYLQVMILAILFLLRTILIRKIKELARKIVNLLTQITQPRPLPVDDQACLSINAKEGVSGAVSDVTHNKIKHDDTYNKDANAAIDNLSANPEDIEHGSEAFVKKRVDQDKVKSSVQPEDIDEEYAPGPSSRSPNHKHARDGKSQRSASPRKKPYRSSPNDDKTLFYDEDENIEKQYKKQFGTEHKPQVTPYEENSFKKAERTIIDDEEYHKPDDQMNDDEDMYQRGVTSHPTISHDEILFDDNKAKSTHVAEDGSSKIKKDSNTRPHITTTTTSHKQDSDKRPDRQLQTSQNQRSSSTSKDDNINEIWSDSPSYINRQIFEKSDSLTGIDQSYVSNASNSENKTSIDGSFPSEEVFVTDSDLKKRDDEIQKYGSPSDIARATSEISIKSDQSYYSASSTGAKIPGTVKSKISDKQSRRTDIPSDANSLNDKNSVVRDKMTDTSRNITDQPGHLKKNVDSKSKIYDKQSRNKSDNIPSDANSLDTNSVVRDKMADTSRNITDQPGRLKKNVDSKSKAYDKQSRNKSDNIPFDVNTLNDKNAVASGKMADTSGNITHRPGKRSVDSKSKIYDKQSRNKSDNIPSDANSLNDKNAVAPGKMADTSGNITYQPGKRSDDSKSKIYDKQSRNKSDNIPSDANSLNDKNEVAPGKMADTSGNITHQPGYLQKNVDSKSKAYDKQSRNISDNIPSDANSLNDKNAVATGKMTDTSGNITSQPGYLQKNVDSKSKAYDKQSRNKSDNIPSDANVLNDKNAVASGKMADTSGNITHQPGYIQKNVDSKSKAYDKQSRNKSDNIPSDANSFNDKNAVAPGKMPDTSGNITGQPGYLQKNVDSKSKAYDKQSRNKSDNIPSDANGLNDKNAVVPSKMADTTRNITHQPGKRSVDSKSKINDKQSRSKPDNIASDANDKNAVAPGKMADTSGNITHQSGHLKRSVGSKSKINDKKSRSKPDNIAIDANDKNAVAPGKMADTSGNITHQPGYLQKNIDSKSKAYDKQSRNKSDNIASDANTLNDKNAVVPGKMADTSGNITHQPGYLQKSVDSKSKSNDKQSRSKPDNIPSDANSLNDKNAVVRGKMADTSGNITHQPDHRTRNVIPTDEILDTHQKKNETDSKRSTADIAQTPDGTDYKKLDDNKKEVAFSDKIPSQTNDTDVPTQSRIINLKTKASAPANMKGTSSDDECERPRPDICGPRRYDTKGCSCVKDHFEDDQDLYNNDNPKPCLCTRRGTPTKAEVRKGLSKSYLTGKSNNTYSTIHGKVVDATPTNKILDARQKKNETDYKKSTSGKSANNAQTPNDTDYKKRNDNEKEVAFSGKILSQATDTDVPTHSRIINLKTKASAPANMKGTRSDNESERPKPDICGPNRNVMKGCSCKKPRFEDDDLFYTNNNNSKSCLCTRRRATRKPVDRKNRFDY